MSQYRAYFAPGAVDPWGTCNQGPDDGLLRWELEILPRSNPGSCCDDEYIKQIGTALNKLKSCPVAKLLWDELNQKGKIKIECDKNSKFGASVGLGGGGFLIKIGCGQKENELVEQLLFEMINIHGLDDLVIYNRFASQGLIGRVPYARLIEKLEYKTLKWHHQLFSSCVAKGFWDETANSPVIKELVGFNLTADEYVDLLIETGDAHFNSYQQDWDRRYKKAWCAKKENKNHPDCK